MTKNSIALFSPKNLCYTLAGFEPETVLSLHDCPHTCLVETHAYMYNYVNSILTHLTENSTVQFHSITMVSRFKEAFCPPFFYFPIILFLSTTLLTGMAGISLQMQ
jgi:hypothetical protein